MASDIHLGPSIMHTNQAFYRFLKHAEREADALILAGDIFNVWFGDDVALKQPQPWLREAMRAFIECAQHTPIYFIHGNRDFLLGHQLCQELGVHLLPPETLIRSDAGLLYVCHGDEFCTDDVRYMALRRKLRNPRIQALFLALPRVVRQAIAKYARYMSQRSQRKTYEARKVQHSAQELSSADSADLSSSTGLASGQQPSNDYYDVNDAAIEQALLAVQAELGELPDLMIHGHTHKPALHNLPNLTTPRIVLPDWDFDHQPEQPRSGFLKVEKKSVSLLPWENDSLTPIHFTL